MYKKLISGKKAVLFDLDGTIVDTEYLWKTALINVLRGVAPNVEDHYELGVSITEIVKNALETSEEKKGHSIKEFVDRINVEYVKLVRETNLQPKEGFWDLIYELKEEKKLKVGLVTNTRDVAAKEVMINAGLVNAFDITVFGNNVVKPKPDPAIYNMAAKMLKLKGHEILVFEDSIAGVTAALKAHMDVVAIMNEDLLADDYPQGILLALTDFQNLAGNLD